MLEKYFNLLKWRSCTTKFSKWMDFIVCMKKVEKMSPIFWPHFTDIPFLKKSHIFIHLWQQQQLLFSFSQRRPALDWSSPNAQSCCHHLLQAAVLPLYTAVPCTRTWVLLCSVFNSTSLNTLKFSWTHWVLKMLLTVPSSMQIQPRNLTIKLPKPLAGHARWSKCL